MKRTFLLLIFYFSVTTSGFSQKDSIVFSNGNIIVGEMKSMTKGVLVLKTDYSDSDFKIEWKGIREIYSETIFILSSSKGDRYSGNLKSGSDGKLFVLDEDSNYTSLNRSEVVFLKSLENGVWSRLSASIDFGYNYTKANNLQQLSIRSTLGYLTKHWQAEITYNDVSSTQDNAENIERTDASIQYKYLLPQDWYTLTNLSFLSNNEQKLKLRTLAKMGFGKFVIHTNKMYLGFNAGGTYNNEEFNTEPYSKQESWEAFLGTEFNMFDTGDISLYTQAVAYPSLTESGRWRGEFRFDAKYDLPLDFYIRCGFTLNYDNRPVEGASESDYVVQTSIGWEF